MALRWMSIVVATGCGASPQRDATFVAAARRDLAATLACEEPLEVERDLTLVETCVAYRAFEERADHVISGAPCVRTEMCPVEDAFRVRGCGREALVICATDCLRQVRCLNELEWASMECAPY